MLEPAPFGLHIEVECLCGTWREFGCRCSGLRWRLVRIRRHSISFGRWREMNEHHFSRLPALRPRHGERS